MATITDPLTMLMQDHQRILGHLETLRRGLKSLADGKPGAETVASMRQAAQTLAREIDLHSLKKEEQALFPSLTEVIGPMGPVAVMIAEHRELDARLPQLLQELGKEKPDVSKVRALIEFIADLLPPHIQKEDYILYPLAKERLSGKQMARIVTKFEELEKAQAPPKSY
ncbi:MAG: hemerythrin domain-containing protein [Chloroflexi bacterium]|nr:hemerythrin domain-containing protein [Chloroflexota bacterium]